MERLTKIEEKQHCSPASLPDPQMFSMAEIPPGNEAQAESLRSREFAIPEALSERQVANRSSLLGWWIKASRDLLELKFRTIEIAIKLFDNYCYLKCLQDRSSQCPKGKNTGKNNCGKGHPHILDSKNESNLTATACFFSAAKYNEIYPPGLNDFVYFDQEHLSKQAVIMREVDIVQVTKCGYNYALLTDWYNLLSETPCPDWGYRCLLRVPMARTELLAQAIRHVVTTVKGSSESSNVFEVFVLLAVKILGVLQKSDQRQPKAPGEKNL